MATATKPMNGVPTNTASVTDEGLARIDQAKNFLEVSRSQVYSLMESGQLVYCKIGRCRRIPWAVLRAFANAALVQK